MSSTVESMKNVPRRFRPEDLAIVASVVYRAIENADDAQDIIQDVLLQVLLLSEQTQDVEILRRKGSRLARNAVRKHLRRIENMEEISDGYASDASSPERLFFRTGSRLRFDDALAEFPAKHQRSLELVMQGMTLEQIASECGSTVGRIRCLHYRLRRTLRQKLSDFLPHSEEATDDACV